MDLKQLYFTNPLKSAKNKANSKNSVSKQPDLSGAVADTDNALENHFMLRMQEMEEINTHLEELVGLQKKELAEVTATNNKFISILAHDLRGPFSSILGALGIIKENLNDCDVDEIEKLINLASNSASRTLTLLDNLLTWTIAQGKEKSFNPTKANLHELVAYEIESVLASSTQKQISIRHSMSPDLNVTADIQMVKTVLRNMLSNAIKYSNPGGEIWLSAQETEPYVEISIKDNGVGIPTTIQQNLFKIDAFQSTAGTNNERGTGLGLLLCKEFIELHGGNIWIESEPGKGSEFKFTLPHYI